MFDVSDWTPMSLDNSAKGADGTDLADINHDGIVDIATAWEQSGQVHLLLSNTSGSYDTIVVAAHMTGAEDAHLVDLDGDGRFEIVSALQEGRKLAISRATDDTYTHWVTDFIAGSKGTSWLYSDSADFNGDGRVDIVAGGDNKAGLTLFAQQADGTFTRSALAPSAWIMGLEATDFDHDGDNDLVVSDRRYGVYWEENDGAGHFDLHQVGPGITGKLGRPCPCFFDLADMNSDGRTDILIADTPHGGVIWYEQPALESAPWSSHVVSYLADAKAVAIGDLNNDGINEIVATTGKYGHHVVVLSQTADGWSTSTVYDHNPGKYDEVQLVDMNHDGYLDILTSNEKELGVVAFLNGGSVA
jgi:hypothetical protein